MNKAAIIAAVLALSAISEQGRRVAYADVAPAVRAVLGDAGASADRFDAYVSRIEADTARRVAEGDRDHLIYYALQSRRFTSRPRIEPALSAQRYVDGLTPQQRARLLVDAAFVPSGGMPPAERARLAELLMALEAPTTDTRLAYFRDIVATMRAPLSPDAFYPDYVRAARFLYLKEFASGQDREKIAELYRTRPVSSDTQIDAGFAVYTGVGVLQALEPALRVRRVLVVGPGLDLAPRTDLIDTAEPRSYQPFAVADALIAFGLATERNLHVHAVDVNARVVRAVQDSARRGAMLDVFSGFTETPEWPFTPEYRSYVRGLGRAIGEERPASATLAADRQYQHSIAVRPSVTQTFTAEHLNVVTQRLVGAPFDVVVATNVLTYFDDRQLALALSNLAATLAPGGYLLHNENRAGLVETAEIVGLPTVQMRTVVLGGPKSRPLYDLMWLHRRRLP